jgi:hypothetical protein
MYSLTICFGPAATSWAFMFKEKENAQAHFSSAMSAMSDAASWRIIDDFGQEAFFEQFATYSALLEDLDLTEQARIERSMVDARAQTKFNVRAKSDPTIQAAMRGPSVISPMGRG